MTFFRYVVVMGLCTAVETPHSTSHPPRPLSQRSASPTRQSDEEASSSDTDVSAAGAVKAAIQLVDQMEAAPLSDEQKPAVEQLDRFIAAIEKAQPENPWLLFLRGRRLAATGHMTEAVTSLRAFARTRAGRHEWRVHLLLGDVFVEEFPQLAQASYEKADALKPRQAGIQFGLSRCARKLGRLDDAIRLARKAASQKPVLRYHVYLARQYLAGHRWEQARQVAGHALDAVRKQQQDHPGKRRPIERTQAVYALWIDILQNRITAPDAKPDHYLELADALRQQAENARILSLFDVLDVLQSGLDDLSSHATPSLRQRYAVTLAEVGRRAEAIAQFDELLREDPTNSIARDWLHRLREEQHLDHADAPR